MYEYEIQGGQRTRTAADPEGSTKDPAPGQLQAAVGNRAVARLLQREPIADEEEETVQAKHDLTVQRQATEEEDEEQRVMASHDTSVQRQEDDEEEEVLAKHDPASAAPEVGLAGGPLSDGLAGRIDAQRGQGSPLDDTTRTTMEGALGSSLDGVRVHVGAESDALNRSISARAFTTGSDVFVRSDEWAPGSSSTQRLMAHELTHVTQQRSTVGDGGAMSVGASDTAEEREADDVADVVSRLTGSEPDEVESS